MSDGRFYLVMIGLLILGGAVVLFVTLWAVGRRRQSVAILDDDIPPYDIPILFQPRSVPVTAVPPPSVAAQPATPPPERQAEAAAKPAAPAAPAPAPSAPAVRPESPPEQRANGGSRIAWEMVYEPPAGYDATMQLLPGRLEPINGGNHQEIRFVKLPGVNRFTFGRSRGPEYVHVQLRAPTTSRMHGYMVFENGRWRIGNMSETNPVVVNGSSLPSLDQDRMLEDGDQIEFGEVGFVFRER